MMPGLRTRRCGRGDVAFNLALREIFFQWLPIVGSPPFGEVLALALWEAGMVEDQFGARAFFDERKLCNRVLAWVPTACTPSLDDSLVGNELEVTSRDVSAKRRESAAHIGAD